MTIGCFGLAACGSRENIERVELDTQVQDTMEESQIEDRENEDDQNEEQIVEEINLLEEANQIALIAEKRAEWFVEDDENLYVYTVTDLNQNGRLELISTSTQGSGLYSYTNYFEVTEDGTALEKWNRVSEDASAPDVGYAMFPVFCDQVSGNYTYIINDFWRAGMAESGAVVIGVTYFNGEIEETILGSEVCSYDEETQLEIMTYYNAQNEEITAEEYETLAQTVYQGLEEKIVFIQWDLSEDFATQDLESALTSMYQGFLIE